MRFLDLPERLAEVRGRIDAAAARGGRGQQVRIVAVTKTFGAEAVTAAWQAGLTDVGENRVQEAIAKKRAVQVPVRWHLIGHLQRNKLKHLPEFDLVHSLDSMRLAEAVSAAASASRPFDMLVQVNVAGEETKGGFEPSEMKSVAERLASLPGIRVRGVMTMAPFEASERRLREVFSGARAQREVLVAAGHGAATELSMGMSGDYEVAVEEGATCVRLGTLLFGARS